MKRIVLVALGVLLLVSCNQVTKGDASRFKEGVFRIPEGNSYSETIIERKDSLQIEKYTKYIEVSTDSGAYTKSESKVDTLYITWKNNFFYTLKMKNPKTELDKDPIFCQITKVSDSSYNFTAKIGYSNFKQEGTVFKIK